MSVCPWCRAEVREPSAPCLNCGKLAADHPSAQEGARQPNFGARGATLDFNATSSQDPRPSAQRSARRVPSAAPELGMGMRAVVSFEDEDDDGQASGLEVAPVAPRTRSSGPASHLTPSSGRTRSWQEARDSGGAMFDDDDMGAGGGSGVSLELDVPPANRMSRISSMAPSGPPGPRASHGARSVVPVGSTGGSARPKLTEAPPTQAIEARLLANFGPSPTSWWQAPLYAWRVRGRLAELRQAVARRRQDAEKASAETQAALVALGQRARSAAEHAPSYGRTLEGLKNAESALRSCDGALMADMDAHAKKVAVLDQRVQKLEQELSAALSVERRLANELAVMQAAAQRAEAQGRRLDIDIRNAAPARDSRRGS